MSYHIVAPHNILQELQARKLLGKSHLVLAHDVVKYPTEYQTIFKETYTYDWSIILDNSAYELGGSVDFNMVKEAAEIVGPTCIVLPDQYLKGPETSNAILETLDHWAQLTYPLYGKGRVKPALMAIPQGRNLMEWIDCVEALASDERIGWWGIPRNFREVLGHPRMMAVQIAHALKWDRQIHLFGFSNDYTDDFLTARHVLNRHFHYVRGIDSTTPIRLGSLGIPFSLTTKTPPRGDWWESAQWDDQIIENLAYARKLFGGFVG